MKKLYNLLLLSTLLLFGVSNAWAADYIKGSFIKDGDDQWVGQELSYTGSTGTVDIFLSYNETYSFGLEQWYQEDEVWKSRWWNGQNFTANDHSSKTLSTDGSNCSITSSAAGMYTFSVTWTDGSPVVTITYPTGTAYSVFFDKESLEWGSFNAHIYTSASKNITGDWPGDAATLVSGSIYKVEFESSVVPANIIWSNNGSSQTSAFSFVNKAVYNTTGIIAYSITPTPDGYATFYHPTYKASVPGATVKAYTGTYNSSTSTLTLHELTGTYCNIIPADCPVVLHSDNGATAFNVNINNGENAGGIYGTNNLHGTSAEVTTPANSYVLGYQGSTTAFYSFTGATIPANKAYLTISGGIAQAAGIRIVEANNDATNIESIEANDEAAVKFLENGKLFIKKNGVVYDMTGAIVK